MTEQVAWWLFGLFVGSAATGFFVRIGLAEQRRWWGALSMLLSLPAAALAGISGLMLLFLT